MRVLLTHHRGLGECSSGLHTMQLAESLLAGNHEVRCLVVDRRSDGDDRLPVRRVVCSPHNGRADLRFDVPEFTLDPASGRSFCELEDEQLVDYRTALRKALDEEVESFDPHIIHAQHIWIQAQLALETGVPYLVTAWGPELHEYQADSRYRAMADQAAENAGRILIARAGLGEVVASMFVASADRLEVLDHAPVASAEVQAGRTPPGENADSVVPQIVAAYEQVLQQRFGR